MKALSKSEESKDGSARVGNVRQRIPKERDVLEHDEYCIPLQQTNRNGHGYVLTDAES